MRIYLVTKIDYSSFYDSIKVCFPIVQSFDHLVKGSSHTQTMCSMINVLRVVSVTTRKVSKSNSRSPYIPFTRQALETFIDIVQNRCLDLDCRLFVYPSIINITTNKTHDLWGPEVQCSIHEGSPIIPIPSRINPNSCNDACFFKTHSNIALPSTTRPS